MSAANAMPTMRIVGLDADELNKLAQQVDARRHEIEEVDRAVKTLQRFIGGSAQATPPSQPQPSQPQPPQPQPQAQPAATTHKPRTRTMSPEARKKIAASMKKHWASQGRGKKRPQGRKQAARGKQAQGRPLSAAAKAKISEKQKANWAARRAGQPQPQSQPEQQPQVAAPEQQQVA